MNRNLLWRAAPGFLVLCALLSAVSTTVAAASPKVRVQRAIVLARNAADTVQAGQAGVVDLAQLGGNRWRIRLVGARTFTSCPTPGPGPRYPCDPVAVWSGEDVTIDARSGRALHVSPLQLAGLVPVHAVRAEVAIRTALRREQRLGRSKRSAAYVSGVRYGYFVSFRLGVTCPVRVCDLNALYWDVAFSGMKVRAGVGGVESHFDVVIDALTGDVVLVAATK